jgi:hypothetical protein
LLELAKESSGPLGQAVRELNRLQKEQEWFTHAIKGLSIGGPTDEEVRAERDAGWQDLETFCTSMLIHVGLAILLD